MWGAALTVLGSPQEYLEVQRQLAIQRLQEQEKERQLRLEQQKQTVQMRAQMPAFSLPYAQLQALPPAGSVLYQPTGPTSFPGTFSPASSVEGSPMHTVYMSQPAAAGGPYPSMPSSAAGKVPAFPWMGLGPQPGTGQIPGRQPPVLFLCPECFPHTPAHRLPLLAPFTLT